MNNIIPKTEWIKNMHTSFFSLILPERLFFLCQFDQKWIGSYDGDPAGDDQHEYRNDREIK